jgi:hypothetical protein
MGGNVFRQKRWFYYFPTPEMSFVILQLENWFDLKEYTLKIAFSPFPAVSVVLGMMPGQPMLLDFSKA